VTVFADQPAKGNTIIFAHCDRLRAAGGDSPCQDPSVFAKSAPARDHPVVFFLRATDTMPENPSVLRPIDESARALARQLLRATPTAALATIDPHDGSPLASLVTVATDLDGSPLLLISALSGHTSALRANPRCSLLLTRPGAGDPLAHPRLTLVADALFLERGCAAGQRARRRFLARHHKAALYADFGDFSFVRLAPVRASLNGGFGRAYEMKVTDFMASVAVDEAFLQTEASAVEHMNQDHRQAIARYAAHFCQAQAGDWQISGIDPDGADLVLGQQVARMMFEPALSGAGQMHARLVAMATEARKG
jgi:putative heme iron utilization protein